MNPAPSPSAPVYAITEENPPQFPCYLWHPGAPFWTYYEDDSAHNYGLMTHWCATRPATPPEHAPALPSISPLPALPSNQEAGNQSGSFSQTEPNRDLQELIAKKAALVAYICDVDSVPYDVRESGIDAVVDYIRHNFPKVVEEITKELLSVIQPVMAQQQEKLETERRMRKTMESRHGEVVSELTALRAQLAAAEERATNACAHLERFQDERDTLRTQLADAVEGRRVAEEDVARGVKAINDAGLRVSDGTDDPCLAEAIRGLTQQRDTLRATNAKLEEDSAILDRGLKRIGFHGLSSFLAVCAAYDTALADATKPAPLPPTVLDGREGQ